MMHQATWQPIQGMWGVRIKSRGLAMPGEQALARKVNGEEKTVVLESFAGSTPAGDAELWHITEKRPFRMGGRGSFARRPAADQVPERSAAERLDDLNALRARGEAARERVAKANRTRAAERASDESESVAMTNIIDVGPVAGAAETPAEPDGGFARLLAGVYVPRFDVAVGR